MEIAEYRKTLGKVFSGFVFDEMVKSDNGLKITRLSYNPDLISNDKKDINDLTM